MAEAELQTYRDQLAFVNLSLEAEPDNADLLSLKTELLEIIELTQAANPSASAGGSGSGSGKSAQASASTSADKEAPSVKGKGKEKESTTASGSAGGANTNWQDQGTFKAGADCMAKYRDGKWYPARINAVIGSRDSPLYTITFKGYSSSTNVPATSLRPHDPSAIVPDHSKSTKRGADDATDREKEKKKKKGEKWVATQTARSNDMKDKKQAWEKFGKKASKKGIHISGLEGKSVFRTPDSVTGRVGVVGSGSGMSQYERMGKHKFEREE